jgi:outer membrane murein-binding lipoprotein Lpp
MYYLKNKALYALIACALFLVTGCTHKNKKNKPSTSPATIIAEGASLHKITGNHQFNTAILRFI